MINYTKPASPSDIDEDDFFRKGFPSRTCNLMMMVLRTWTCLSLTCRATIKMRILEVDVNRHISNFKDPHPNFYSKASRQACWLLSFAQCEHNALPSIEGEQPHSSPTPHFSVFGGPDF